MNLKDEYVDNQGRSYKPVMHTESYCFLKSDHYGSVSVRMCRIDQETGEVKFNRLAYGFREAAHNPELWMQQNSEGMPKRYIPEATRQALDAAGICENCSESELIELNEQRLRDSQKLKEGGNE